jgi:RimJ/RimL family protein N-acetyltransferase
MPERYPGPAEACQNRAVFTADAQIETERLLLRPYREDDVDDLLDTRSRPEVMRYLYGEVGTRAEVVDLIAERAAMTRLAEEGDGLVLAAERRSDRRVIGDVSLAIRSLHHRQAEIGFVFNPDGQGRGYATEAATAVLAIAFGPCAMHRVYGRTDARNTGSAALMRRLGMRQESHLRESEIFKGEWGDELLFAILEDEWRALHDGARPEE